MRRGNETAKMTINREKTKVLATVRRPVVGSVGCLEARAGKLDRMSVMQADGLSDQSFSCESAWISLS